jgi:hypothetical protein
MSVTKGTGIVKTLCINVVKNRLQSYCCNILVCEEGKCFDQKAIKFLIRSMVITTSIDEISVML